MRKLSNLVTQLEVLKVLRHVFTVDVEDWYHGIPIDELQRASAEERLHYSLDMLLQILADYEVKGTFFWIGPLAVKYPFLVRKVVKMGHTIGCHGWTHDFVYNMSHERFRCETRRALKTLTDITGKPIVAYRAPYFSITKKSFWALDILASLGFQYDLSIFPVRNWRYGIPNFDPRPRQLQTSTGNIYVIPASVRQVLGYNIPSSGGAYFRIYPYKLTRSNFMKAEVYKCPIAFYIHPWELDANHPRISFYWKARMTHYFGLQSTKSKLHRLLQDFSFGSLSEVIEDYLLSS